MADAIQPLLAGNSTCVSTEVASRNGDDNVSDLVLISGVTAGQWRNT